MDKVKRKPFQGVLQILQFNWHMFVLAFATLLALIILYPFVPQPIQKIIILFTGLTSLTIFTALAVSWYVYDFSGLYSFDWMPPLIKTTPSTILNIHAGFDESSAIVENKFKGASLQVYDFYDPSLHREISIKRARKKFPPYPGTISISTIDFPKQKVPADLICLFLSAHEIRNEDERIQFFIQLKNNLAAGGQILLVEHLRNLPNFLAYTLGAFHFHSRSTWLECFAKSGLSIVCEQRFTPFIAIFYLKKNDTTS
jgi:hypothetical protein